MIPVPPAELRVSVLSADMSTVLVEALDAFDVRASKVHAARTGGGELSVVATDPDATALVAGNVVQVSVPDGAGGWVPWFAWVLRRVDSDSAAVDADGVETIRWSGPELSSLLDDGQVRPNGFEQAPFADTRVFDWSSPELDDSAWTAPNVRGLVTDMTLPAVSLAGRPFTFPSSTARWLWGSAASGTPAEDAPGFTAFRREVALDAGTHVLYATADDLFDVRVDGVPMIDYRVEFGDASVATRARVFRLTAPRTVVVSALVENVPRLPAGPGAPFGNVGMFCLSIFERFVEAGGTETEVVSTGSAGWLSTHIPGGFTADKIIDLLVSEDVATAGWTITASGVFDTIPESTFTCPSTVGEAVDKLVDGGWCEVTFSAESLEMTVQPVQPPGAPVVTFDSAVGVFERLTWTEDHAGVAGRLLVRFANGWTEVGSGGAADAVTLGDVFTASAAAGIGTSLLTGLGEPRRTVAAVIDPPAATAQPGRDWDAGSWVEVDGEVVRCVGLTASEDENGMVLWAPEFATLAEDREDRLARIARRMTPGALSGRSSLVAPAAIVQPEAVELRPERLTWSWSGTAADVAGASIKSLPIDRLGRITAAEVLVDAAPGSGGASTVTVSVDGVPAQTVVLAEGAVREVVRFVAPVAPPNVVSVSASGGLHESGTVTLTFAAQP